MARFLERLDEACQSSESLVCVGLDPDPKRMPAMGVADFNAAIVEATAGLACAYKPNLAFYEALGIPGLTALEQTVTCIRNQAPHAIVIGDAKRGDMGPSSEAYRRGNVPGLGLRRGHDQRLGRAVIRLSLS